MKKKIVCCFTIVMAVTLAACGGQAPEALSDNGNQEIPVNLALKVEDTEGRTKLTLACFTLDPLIEERIVDFNNTNTEYYIEVLDYSQFNTADDFTAGDMKLKTDIMGGNTPDLIEIGQTPIEIYTNKGLFVDLNEFLEIDEQFSRSTFVPGALRALSSGDKLYRLSPYFTVVSLYGKSSTIGQRTSWTLPELQNFLAEHSSVEMAFVNMPYAHVLHSLSMYTVDQFVDGENGLTNFKSDAFITLLETVKEYSRTESLEYKEVSEELLADRGLLATGYIGNVKNFASIYDELQGDLNFIGYPTEKGSGNVADFFSTFAMFADSEHKQGAWQFLRSLLDEEFQNRVAQMEIPISLAAYEKVVDDADVSSEVKEAFNLLIASITKSSSFDRTLMNIISEESEDYFQDLRTVEEVADAIQSRASIYIYESR